MLLPRMAKNAIAVISAAAISAVKGVAKDEKKKKRLPA
jgi:hypothetical protein